MKKQIYYTCIMFLFLLAAPILYAATPKNAGKKNNTDERTIVFSYENEDLVNVINFIAAQKEINVVLPQGANAIKAKLTLKIDKHLTIDEAWTLLKTILDVAGFSMIPKSTMVVITKTTPNTSRDPMPVFIGTDLKQLPDTDQRIRYVYYLTNIKVPSAEEEANSELAQLFKGIMQPGYVFKTDSITNAIIVAGLSRDIKAAMRIVHEFDKAGFQEKMIFLPLRHTQANIVARLIMQQVLTPGQTNRYRLDTRQETEQYFSKNTKIIPEPRTNSLIILGRAQAVDRIRDFINEYIDKEIDSGKSILHIKKLQYRDAYQIAEVIKKVLASGRSTISEQARAAQGDATGPERFFEQVKVFADTPAPDQSGNEQGVAANKYKGGNNIIVAARNDDWKRIKKLIEELDNPQPQVLIEVLIADLTVGDQKQFGSQSRRPNKIPLPSQIEPQFAHLQQSMGNDTKDPTSIDADLLRVAYADGQYVQPNSTSTPDQTIASLAGGSTLISFNDNDGKTWSILQVLDTLSYTKILSHPHVISTNNETSLIKVGEYRLVQGGVQNADATATVKQEPITADLEVKITPRVSEGKIVNLTVEIKIQEFVASAGSGDNTRNNRTIVTNANVKDGDILALGGLIRTIDQNGLNETPILSRVPILGWFFKKRTAQKNRTNLTVFISPMIILPRLRGGMSEFTKDYINVSRSYAKEGALFDTLKEPITRWFFKTSANVDNEINKFVEKDEFQANSNTKTAGKYAQLQQPKEFDKISQQKEAEQDNQDDDISPLDKLRTSALNAEKIQPNKQTNKSLSDLNSVKSNMLTINLQNNNKKEKINDDIPLEKLAENQVSEKEQEELQLTHNTQAEASVEHVQKSVHTLTIKEPKKIHTDMMLLTHDKQKRSQALQALIDNDDENPIMKAAQINPVRYLQS